MNSIKLKKFLKNEYIFSVGTKFVTIFLSIIQSIIVARYLGAELKGTNAYISSITSIGSIMVTFGMHQAYPYFRRKYGKDSIYQDYISIVMLIYSIYMLIAIALVCILPCTLELKAAIILVPLLGYSNVVAYVTLVENPNLRNTWWTIISILDIVYVTALWIFTDRNIYWGISVLLFADLIKCIIYTRILHVRPRWHSGMWRLAVELLKYGFFPMLALLMTSLNYRIDVLMLRQYVYISDAMIGIYSLGISLSDRIRLIPDTLKGVLVSKLAKGAPDSEVAKVCRLGFWSSLVVCFLMILLGKWVIKILYGLEYAGAYGVIVITAAGALAISYFVLIAQYNIVNKRQKLNVLMLSIAILVDIVFNLLFIPKWGIEGAAMATTLGNVVCGIVFIVYFCKHTGIKATQMFLIQKSDIDLIKGMLNKS